MQSCLFGLLLLASQLCIHILAVKITDQSVKCDPKQIHVFFEFDQEFDGVVYTKDFFDSSNCKSYGDGSKRVSISIPLNIDVLRDNYCGVSLNRSKHEFSVQLFVNEAKQILVQGLRVFEIQCQYHLEAVTVQLPSLGGIHINSETSANSAAHDDNIVLKGSGSGILPVLDMIIRKGRGIQGQSIQSALIGEEMTLDVFLDDVVPYDLFVYSCIAHDGTKWPSATVTLIDEHGCGNSIERVTTPPVQTTIDTKGIKHIFLEMRGFQFSTSDLVHFECQVRPCLHSCNVTQCQSSSVDDEQRLLIEQEELTPVDSNQIKSQNLVQIIQRPAFASNDPDSYNVQTSVKMSYKPDTSSLKFLKSKDSKDIVPLMLRKADVLPSQEDFFKQNEKTKQAPKSEVCFPHGLMIMMLTVYVLACIFCILSGVYVWHKTRKDLNNSNFSDARSAS